MEAKPAPSASLLALRDGTELVGDYRIRRVLGAGGFGITYLADEKALDRLVTVKEYFPADFAARQNESAAPRSQDASADYQWGLDRFIEEAQTLARFDHPNIVRVHRYFRANNTAYMVLHFEDGGSFKSWLKRLGRAPRQAELDRLLVPLLDALEIIHKADFLHRDIAPDNIMVRKDGSPVLIDFGSARGAVASHSRTVSALVKPGYSPYEQYATTGTNQGPWTDIYALGATLYHAATGKRPPDAPSRVVEDDYVPAREAALGSYRTGFLEAIDKALRIELSERPQSIAEWRGALLDPDPVRKPSRLGLRLPRTLGRRSEAKVADAPQAEPVSAAASLVPPPPDVPPQRQGQLLDFIDALAGQGAQKPQARKKKGAPEREAQPSAAPSRAKSQGAAPAAPRFGLGYGPPPPPPPSPARARTAPAAGKAAPAPEPPAVRQPKPRRTWRLVPLRQPKPRRTWRLVPSRGWRVAVVRVVAAVAAASLAVAFHENAPRLSAPKGAAPAGLAPAATEATQLAGHVGAVVAVAAADEGRSIVSAGADATLRLWNAGTGAPERTIVLEEGPVTALAVDGRRALVGHGNGAMVLWNLEQGHRLALYQHGAGPIAALAFIGDGSTFAAAGEDGSMALFDLDAPAEPAARFDSRESGGPMVATARSGGFMVSSGSDRTLRLWRADGPRLARIYRHPTSDLTAIAISDDGGYVAGAGADGSVRVWRNASYRGVRSRGVRTLEAHQGRVVAIALGPRGLLATAGEDGSVKLWRLRQPREMRRLAEGIPMVRALAFSPDGRRLLAAGRDDLIRVWPLAPRAGAKGPDAPPPTLAIR